LLFLTLLLIKCRTGLSMALQPVTDGRIYDERRGFL
jgi:hypothetical protein